jgi:hypothetical protein
MKKILIFATVFFMLLCSCGTNTNSDSSFIESSNETSSVNTSSENTLGKVIFESYLLDENYTLTQDEAKGIVKALDEHAQKLLREYEFEQGSTTEKITINGGVYFKIPIINTKEKMKREFELTFCENVFADTQLRNFEEHLSNWFYEVDGKLYKFEDVSFPFLTGFWDLENADILVEKGKITVSTTITRNEKLNGEFAVVLENGRWKLDASYFTFGS